MIKEKRPPTTIEELHYFLSDIFIAKKIAKNTFTELRAYKKAWKYDIIHFNLIEEVLDSFFNAAGGQDLLNQLDKQELI